MADVEPLLLSRPSRIKHVREKVGWSQKKLAKEVGVRSAATISRIESEDYFPSFKTLEKIFTVLNREVIGRFDPSKVIASSIMNQPVQSISSSDRVRDAMSMMAREGYSQLPVIDDGVNVGRVTENNILAHALTPDELIKNVHGTKSPLPIISEFTPLLEVREFLLREPAVLVGSDNIIQGIITKHDIFTKVKL
jgi:predicted transcriptional regulator